MNRGAAGFTQELNYAPATRTNNSPTKSNRPGPVSAATHQQHTLNFLLTHLSNRISLLFHSPPSPHPLEAPPTRQRLLCVTRPEGGRTNALNQTVYEAGGMQGRYDLEVVLLGVLMPLRFWVQRSNDPSGEGRDSGCCSLPLIKETLQN